MFKCAGGPYFGWKALFGGRTLPQLALNIFAKGELQKSLQSSISVFTVVVGDSQYNSIQYLNFAKQLFIQYSIQYCFNQGSIQNIIQFKINSADSILKII